VTGEELPELRGIAKIAAIAKDCRFMMNKIEITLATARLWPFTFSDRW
jgi:hypothetical protein